MYHSHRVLGTGDIFVSSRSILTRWRRNFQPEIMLISIGFDAHWQDPLAMASLSLTGYALFVQTLDKSG